VSPRREYALALGLILFGAVLVLVSSGRTWATGEATSGGSTTAAALHVTGNEAAGGLAGLALLAATGIAALVATRGRLRRVVAVVIILAGISVVTNAVFSDLSGALDEAARKSAGVSSAHATATQTTISPWVCVLGGLLIIAGGVLAALHGPSWPGLGARYERGPATLDPWSALDQGIDPTLEPEPIRPEDVPPDRMPTKQEHGHDAEEQP
jgi:uncharacterized membrane protein (TIGR02234 family)